MEAYISSADSRKQSITEFVARNGQQFLPLLEVLMDAREQLQAFTHAVGLAAIEGMLDLSATQLTGEKHPGKACVARSDTSPVRRYGHQQGVVAVGQSKVRVKRPRLRTAPDAAGKTREVEPPAYTALKNDPQLSRRIMGIALGGGVSTRKYQKVLDETAQRVGISKSQVSRELKKAMTTALAQVQARVIPGADILAVYIDGFVVGDIHVIGAIGVKKDGTKMVLGVRQGATENLVVVTALLTDLRDRGLAADIPRLFVLDGGKALHRAVEGVYGDHAVIQRCRNHKLRNVMDHLPEKQRAHAKLVLKAAFALADAGKGIEKLQQYAAELERGGWSSAAGSLREGLEELFTINALGLPTALCRCLGTTNLLDAAHSGTRGLLRRVSTWRDGDMAERWVAAAMVETEKHFKKIHGYKQLWMLESQLKAWVARRKARTTDAAPATLAPVSVAA
jgi:transposase-like protein